MGTIVIVVVAVVYLIWSHANSEPPEGPNPWRQP
jgi:hypothetical protein